MKIYRQGDVLIMEAPDLQPGGYEIRRNRGRVVLAYGEVTGHAHAIAEPAVDFYTVPGTDDRLLVIREAEAILRHEEHAPITLPQGRYIVRQQREYAPGEVRYVVDYGEEKAPTAHPPDTGAARAGDTGPR